MLVKEIQLIELSKQTILNNKKRIVEHFRESIEKKELEFDNNQSLDQYVINHIKKGFGLNIYNEQGIALFIFLKLFMNEIFTGSLEENNLFSKIKGCNQQAEKNSIIEDYLKEKVNYGNYWKDN